MCKGLNANVHVSQTGLPPLPLSLSYPFKHESICLLNYHLTLFSSWMWTSLQRTSLSSLLSVRSLLSPRLHCTLFVPIPSISPSLSPSLSLSLSYYYLTSIQWRVECIYGGSVLADSCWHTQGPLRNHPEAVRRSLGSQQPHIHKSEMDVLSGYTIMSDCPMHTHLHISPVHSAWQRGLTSSHALSTGFGGESTHPHIEDRAFMHPLLERTCFYLWCCCILNPFLGQSIFFFNKEPWTQTVCFHIPCVGRFFFASHNRLVWVFVLAMSQNRNFRDNGDLRRWNRTF